MNAESPPTLCPVLSDLQRQITFDDHILALCHIAALNACDRAKESGKRTESFTKITQGPKKPLLIFYKD